MNKTCQVCGHTGENVWRDGKYYCASCGSEIDVTEPSYEQPAGNSFEASVPISAVCPICKNANGNYLQNGQCHCSLCGSAFSIQQQSNYDSGYSNSYYGPSPDLAARRAELEQQKNKKLLWGIVWLFLFWPVSIYHFVKMYQISQEISNLY